MSSVDSIISVAKSYIGISEGSSKHKEVIDLYNKGRYSDAYQMTLSDPWCCAFVVACFVKCGASDIIPGVAYCDGMINYFKQWGRWKGRFDTVKVGDIIFYDWNGDGSSDHVGIVIQNQFGDLSVIEGNKSDTVGYRKISINSAQIVGYGVPNYEASGMNDSQEESTILVGLTDDEYIKTLPIIKMGDKNVYVKIMQLLLNYYVGSRLDIDGDFGPRTKSAVATYQMANHLEVDGIVGPETWAFILLKETSK